MRALISVADKTGLVPFAKRIVASGFEIVASGGSAAAIGDAGIAVTAVEDVTGAPEMLGGRVKTLHPAIHGGILADTDDPAHLGDLAAAGIHPVSMVVCNLYPFEETVAGDPTRDEAIEQIDIGGVALLRAAAKNHAHVTVVSDPSQYEEVATALEGSGVSDAQRVNLARAAFFRTASYDAAIVQWLESDEALPSAMVLPMQRQASLRYGENPHQPAAAYGTGTGWWRTARQLQGKELSFNNLVDAEAAWRLANDIDDTAAVVVKHTNACGAAVADSIADAVELAWACDPVSAFGGIVAVNRPLDAGAAEFLAPKFIEVVIAPSVDGAAAEILSKKEALRVLEAVPPTAGGLDLRVIDGGVLAQERDAVDANPNSWTHVAGPEPSDGALAGLSLAWTVCAHTKSNAIVIVADGAAVGVGAGDQSRVGAAERAISRAGERAAGGVAASDAFFPFRDGLDKLVDAGVIAVVQPGGSRRDDEVVAAANERGVTMMVTGMRHFRH